MEKPIIKKGQIDLIQDNSFDTNFWMYQLGMSISDSEISNENRFSFDFLKAGRNYWNTIEESLFKILCDREKKIPKSIFDEVLNGDIRNLIVYLITIVVTDLGVIISVAIPIVSLLLKTGLKNFCKNC